MINAFAVVLLLSFPVTLAFGQPPVAPPQEAAKLLKEFPKEFVHEGTRIYATQLDPKPDSTFDAGTRVVMKFKYKTDAPGKVHVGAMPLKGDAYMGGYQPAALVDAEGTAEVGVMFGGYCGGGGSPANVTPTMPEELKASYVTTDTLEVQIYGQTMKQGKWRAPQEFTMILLASFTIRDKYHFNRLAREVLALRKRVEELEGRK